MKSPIQKHIDLDLSDTEIEKVLYETKSKFSLIKQLNLSATKSKFNHIECQYESALVEASLQLKSVDSKIALERRRINQAIQNIKTDKKKTTNHLSWSPVEVITDGKKFLQARRSHNKIEVIAGENTFLSPRGTRENKKDHKRRLFYEFDKMRTVENWKTTLGSNGDEDDFVRGQPVRDFEKEINKIVMKINHPSVKDPREILKSLLIPSPVPDYLLQQQPQQMKKSHSHSKNASGISLKSNTIEVDMNIVDGEGGFRRIKHQYNPEKLQKKIIEKYSNYLTDKRYDTQVIVRKITNEYSKALKKINRNGLMVKVPKNFKVWMQDFNDFYQERAENDVDDDYPDYLVQKQLDEYLDNKLNNEVDKNLENSPIYGSQPDLRKATSPKKRVMRKNTQDAQGTFDGEYYDDEEEEEEEEDYEEEHDTEEDYEERMEKRRSQQYKNKNKQRRTVIGEENEEDEQVDENEDDENEEEDRDDENEEEDEEEEEIEGGIITKLETKKSQHTGQGEEESEDEEDGAQEQHGKKVQNSKRVMKKVEEKPQKKEFVYKERKTYSTVKKYEAIQLTKKESKQDPNQTQEAIKARQREIEAEQKKMNDYYNERINSINNKYKEPTDAKSPANKIIIKKQNSKDSQGIISNHSQQLGNSNLRKDNNQNRNIDASPNNLRQSQISYDAQSVCSEDLVDNDRESTHDLRQSPRGIDDNPTPVSIKSSGTKKTTKSKNTSKKPKFDLDMNSASLKTSPTKSKKQTRDSTLQLAKRSSAADAIDNEKEEHEHEDYSPMHKSALSGHSKHSNDMNSKTKNRDRARTHNQSPSPTSAVKTEESSAHKHTTQLSNFSPRKHLENPQTQNTSSKSKGGAQKNSVIHLKTDDQAQNAHRYSLSPNMKSQVTNEGEGGVHKGSPSRETAPNIQRVRSAKLKKQFSNEKDERNSLKYSRQSTMPHPEQINADYHNVYTHGPEPAGRPEHQRHHSSSSKPDRYRSSVQPQSSYSHANTPKSKYKQEARFSVALSKSNSPTLGNNGFQANGMGYDFGYGLNNPNKLDPNNLRNRKQSNLSPSQNLSKDHSTSSMQNTRTSLYKKETTGHNSTSKFVPYDPILAAAVKIVDTEFTITEIPIATRQSVQATEVNSPEVKKKSDQDFDLDKYLQDIKNQTAKRSHTIIDMLLAAPSVMENDITVIERPPNTVKVPQNLKFESQEYGNLFDKIYVWHKTIKADLQDSEPDYLSELEDSVDSAEGEKDEEETTERKEPDSAKTNAINETSDEETRRDQFTFKKK